jgi:hypothetical protein
VTLTLPAPFDQVDIGAHLDRGRRSLTWRLEGPGQIVRNGYEMAWFDVTERDPFRGEPLWLSATRRPLGRSNYGRQGFTDAGRKALSEFVLPVIARYGFDRAWTELHRTKAAKIVEAAAAGEQEALWVAGWWRTQAELAHMLADGLLRFEVVDETYGRWPTVAVMDRSGRRDRQDVVAAAMLDGEQVGWMTRHGDLVPLEDQMQRPARVA